MTESAPVALPRFKTPAGRDRYLAAYDAVLKDWPVPFEELDVATRFGPTHVVASGDPDAPPLVLLPSLAGTATVWRPNVEALSRRFRAYAVDVIGQPGKSLATRRPRTRRDFADWCEDLLDGLGVRSASIVGCSFGGFLALSQAALTPERLDRVVLISPAGTFVDLSPRFKVIMRTSALRRRVRALLGDRRPPSLPSLGGPKAEPHPGDAPWRSLMGVTLAEAPRIFTINAPVLGLSEVRRIQAPTLLLIGDLERLYKPQFTLALAKRRMPKLRGAVVPGADHIAAMAQPDDVNARILSFLDAQQSDLG